MITKTIVVLAKSIKHGKYCIAGKDIITKQWIRPVSDVNGAELSEQQCKCTNDKWQMDGKLPYSSAVLKKATLRTVFEKIEEILNSGENVVSDNSLF